MFLRIRLASPLLVLYLYLAVLESIPWFQTFIPNGSNVPNPCTDEPSIWDRVGHEMLNISKDTNKTLNGFGLDFRIALNKEDPWQYLCRRDSDGDSLENGEELGDPYCTWTVGQPDPPGPITHPGIPDNAEGIQKACGIQ